MWKAKPTYAKSTAKPWTIVPYDSILIVMQWFSEQRTLDNHDYLTIPNKFILIEFESTQHY